MRMRPWLSTNLQPAQTITIADSDLGERGRTAWVVQQEGADGFVDPRKVKIWPNLSRYAFDP